MDVLLGNVIGLQIPGRQGSDRAGQPATEQASEQASEQTSEQNCVLCFLYSILPSNAISRRAKWAPWCAIWAVLCAARWCANVLQSPKWRAKPPVPAPATAKQEIPRLAQLRAACNSPSN